MTQNIIDGYSRDGYVKPFEGVHGGMEFKYRPMLPNEVTRLESKCDKCTSGDHGNITAHVVTKKLEEWGEVDKEGGPVDIEYENVRRLPYDLLATMISIIKGTRAPDKRDSDISGDDELSSIANDICEDTPNPGQRLLEEQGKN